MAAVSGDWPLLRSGLIAVRDLVRKRRREKAGRWEQKAFDAIAVHPAFAGLGPTNEELRGQWVAQAIIERLQHLDQALLTDDRQRCKPYIRAIHGWRLLLTEGLYPVELVDAHPQLFDTTHTSDTRIARRGVVQHALWLGGNRGDQDAAPAIKLIASEIRSAVAAGDGETQATDIDAACFRYEWDLLARRCAEGQDLLRLLCMFAEDTPVPIRLLVEGRDPLPHALRKVVETPASLRQTLTLLSERKLLSASGDNVELFPRTRHHTSAMMSPDDRVHWTSTALRLMNTALPANTHHYETWAVWRVNWPHATAIMDRAEEQNVLLGDLPYLLDRASVYHREGVNDPHTAIDLARRGLAISDRLGRPTTSWHAFLLANLAMALDDCGDMPGAVTQMRACLDFEAESFGTETDEYASSLNVLGSMYKRWGRPKPAGETFQRALETIERIHEDNPTDACREIYIEVLNDYASFLLRQGGKKATSRAEDLLKRAYKLVRPHEHGWTAITTNLASLHRSNNNLQVAEELLRELLTVLRVAGSEPSHALLSILIDLSKTCRALGKTAEADRLWTEAHDVDDALTVLKGGLGPHDRTYPG